MSSTELGPADTAVTSAPSPAQTSDPATITPLTNTTEWRPYTFEHPLTAATSAMLNISGASDDPSSGFGILYDYHYGKMGQLSHVITQGDTHGQKGEKTLSADIWSPVVVNTIEGGTKSNGDIGEGYNSSKLCSVLRRGGEAKIQKMSQNGQRYSNGDLSPHHQPLQSPSQTPHPTVQSHPTGVIILKEEGPRSPGSPRNNITSLHLVSPPAPLTPTSVSPNDDQREYHSPQLFATLSNPIHTSHYDFVGCGPAGAAQFGPTVRGGVYPLGNSPNEPYYRVDFFANEFGASGVTTASRQLSPYDGGHGPETGPSFADRYARSSNYKQGQGALPVDLPSPDSGIGAETIPPRDNSSIQESFDYSDLCQQNLLGEMSGRASPAHSQHSQSHTQIKSSRPWHDFGRQNEGDKIQIPKLFSNFGFRYHLESPISTSQRREDDRITYINKGQFYGISLDFIPSSEKQIKSQTVKSVVMLVFREEKSPEDEIKAWQFWHGRQHSVKQRILDADTKNSTGLVGCIDEIAHNAIAVYWNPMESAAKINVAVQCLSTDFSSQKGVKGLPLHLQIDTYDDPRDPNCPLSHRAYCQIKVFCDKGAERKTRDEERRAAKRKLTANGRKKVEDLYHTPAERSEFYTMSDLTKPPVLFTPAEDIDKLTSLELHGFYNTNSDGSDNSLSAGGGQDERLRLIRQGGHSEESPPRSPVPHSHLFSHQGGTVLKFHHNFPPESPPTYVHTSSLNLSLQGPCHSNSNSPPLPVATHQPVSVISNEKTKEVSESNGSASSTNDLSSDNSVIFSTSPNSQKRMRLFPQPSQRLMIYVREEGEDVFTPLHLVPPTREALLKALEEKYEISLESVRNVFRRNCKGVVVKVDDEMLQHYCHEDSFLLHITRDSESGMMDITLTQTQDTC